MVVCSHHSTDCYPAVNLVTERQACVVVDLQGGALGRAKPSRVFPASGMLRTDMTSGRCVRDHAALTAGDESVPNVREPVPIECAAKAAFCACRFLQRKCPVQSGYSDGGTP